MYKSIREQIKIGKEKKQQILILGDFNVKIRAAIEGKHIKCVSISKNNTEWRKQ